MSNIWNPFEENTKKVEAITRVFSDNLTSILVASTISIICICLLIAYIISEKTNTVPCSYIQQKLEKLEIPQYYEMKPISKDRIKINNKGE